MPRVLRASAGVVYRHPVDEAGSLSVREPHANQPPVLGNLGPHGASAVLNALRRQILAGLLCGSGEKGGQDVGPLVLRPALPTCCGCGQVLVPLLTLGGGRGGGPIRTLHGRAGW